MASASRALLLSRLSSLPAAASRFLRPLASAGTFLPAALAPSPAPAPGASARRFATQPANSASNCSNRAPEEAIPGCDYEHWMVIMEGPPGDASNPDIHRNEIIDGYIKTLAQVVGSEDEARMKIYSVSTRHYFSFGALLSDELAGKLRELPKVRWVLPDSYVDVRNKDYGGEPFVDGQAVPYDPKYHEEWVRGSKIGR
ncbi:multiple organellar RNA editing factor 8, chloroplastic/mitochondrial-like [Triticum aestivum]|uniref:multiple organellar RNA editing factor 8, chloroplastic/mitochondrial-like n=1 Tax=Triticum aestivum TaxID=4565 RepID=UPI001D020386|nr:multiple organellar RNA editing factor 8, chloroplastic/mitochondrial-like [Triticum aestivum]